MNITDERVLVFDTETTGVDVRNDRVVEVGGAMFEGGVRTRLYNVRVNPGVPIPPGATAVHGISDADVSGAAGFLDVGRRFVGHLDGSAADGIRPLLCGYNALSFDVPLLNAELERHGLEHRIDPAQVLDPIVFMKWFHRDLKGRRLVESCEHYGVTLKNAHSAAGDSDATGGLLFAMIAAGTFPADVEVALREQAVFGARLELEWSEFGRYLYRDRQDGRLRHGSGKHVGRLIEEVDRGYYKFMTEAVAELPPAVRAVFDSRR